MKYPFHDSVEQARVFDTMNHDQPLLARNVALHLDPILQAWPFRGLTMKNSL
jgi:hypothetical protein